MRRRVLLVSQPGNAGVAHVVANHVEWAVENGWQPSVACDPESRLAELVVERNGSVEPWTAKRSPTSGVRSEMRALRDILERTSPAVVHLHSSKAGLVGRLLLRGCRPTVFQPHAWSFQASRGASKVLAVGWERWAQRWTDVTVCVSRAEEAAGSQFGVRATIAMLPNSVDTARFHAVPGDSDRARLRAKMGFSADAPVAVCVGRLCEQKGQDLLLAAWPRVLDAVPSAQLVLVGDGPERDRLESQRVANVVFAGAAPDPARWFQIADLAVVPSRWEGQALVILEAMSCAVPIVASDIAPNVETLPRAAGATVPADQPDILAAAIVKRLQADISERAGEGSRGRKHVQEFHDRDRLATRLTEIWEAVADGHRVSPMHLER